MKESSIVQATGRGRPEWFQTIRTAGKGDAPHREIAEYLHRVHGVSPWWAQEITVEFEKHVGRRVLGQTQEGLYQIGVSKTVSAPAHTVWTLLQSPEGIGMITMTPDDEFPAERPATAPDSLEVLDTPEDESGNGIRVRTTTFKDGSHVRLQWQRSEWSSHSILQIRITPKGSSKTTLSFHQEKLPSGEDRETMQSHWRRVAERIAGMAET
jgi:hypothetical protein